MDPVPDGLVRRRRRTGAKFPLVDHSRPVQCSAYGNRIVEGCWGFEWQALFAEHGDALGRDPRGGGCPDWKNPNSHPVRANRKTLGWNVAAGSFAYGYARLALVGYKYVGADQLIGGPWPDNEPAVVSSFQRHTLGVHLHCIVHFWYRRTHPITSHRNTACMVQDEFDWNLRANSSSSYAELPGLEDRAAKREILGHHNARQGDGDRPQVSPQRHRLAQWPAQTSTAAPAWRRVLYVAEGGCHLQVCAWECVFLSQPRREAHRQVRNTFMILFVQCEETELLGLGISYGSPAKCCAMCQALKNCSFFTYSAGGTPGKPTCYNHAGGCCFLKTAEGGIPAAGCPGCTSGSVKPPPAPPADDTLFAMPYIVHDSGKRGVLLISKIATPLTVTLHGTGVSNTTAQVRLATRCFMCVRVLILMYVYTNCRCWTGQSTERHSTRSLALCRLSIV